MTRKAQTIPKGRAWRKLLPLLALLLAARGAVAQDDLQYRWEIGAGVGMATYQGDFSGSIVRNPRVAAAIVSRHVFNPSMALKFTASYASLNGASKHADTYYPAYAAAPYTFNTTLYALGVAYEYNFWTYGTGRDYRGAKRLAPFVFGGIGGDYATGAGANAFTGDLHLGFGVKYKIGKRLNLGLEWAEHFTLSDMLDGVKDPYDIESGGFFKNADCYSKLLVTLTYSFSAKCKTCHNDDE